MNAARHPQPVDVAPHTAPPSPAARRLARPTWRDPRLVVGILLVALPVLVGGRLLASADDTVAVWSARSDLAAGATLAADDLERAEVRFTSEDLAGRYLSVGSTPAGLVLLRDVGAGELVPRDALAEQQETALAELPISVASDAVPAGLRPGQLVDVWVASPVESAEDQPALRVLEQVPVVAAPQSAGALGPSSTRQVVVGVPADDERLLADALARLADGRVVLVRRG